MNMSYPSRKWPGVSKTRLLKMIPLIVGFLCLTAFGVSAQNAQYPEAKLTNDLYLSLDWNQPLSETYVVDISQLDFKSESEASERLNQFNDPHVKFELDYAAKKAYVHLDASSGRTTLEDWTIHLKNKFEEEYKSSKN